MLSILLNCAGLVIDITGAALVFFNSPVVTYRTYLFNREEGERMDKKAKRIHSRAKTGFVLLAVGFAVQLVSNMLTL